MVGVSRTPSSGSERLDTEPNNSHYRCLRPGIIKHVWIFADCRAIQAGSDTASELNVDVAPWRCAGSQNNGWGKWRLFFLYFAYPEFTEFISRIALSDSVRRLVAPANNCYYWILRQAAACVCRCRSTAFRMTYEYWTRKADRQSLHHQHFFVHPLY